MDYVIVIFFLGLIVSGVVAKGMLMANEYAASERDSHDAPKPTHKSDL